MRRLKALSVAITLLGILAVVAAVALDLSTTVVLAGMMLVVAGLVKIAMVGLWRTVAGFGATGHAESPVTGITSEERRR